jgi:predicted peptidase
VSELRYHLYPPAVAGGDRPLIVFLHGSGERGHDLVQVRKYGLPRYLEKGLEIPAYVVAPQCPPECRWGDLIEPLEGMVESLRLELPISARGLLLTGFSMGGFGAWEWAMRNPSRFAALVPVAGSGFTHGDFVLPGDPCVLRELPVWIIHGAADRHVPVGGADRCAEALAACGGIVRYSRFPDADHGETCSLAYSDPRLYEWMMQRALDGGSTRARAAGEG